MNVLAFALIGFMLTAYVLLDGFDLGIGALTPFVARTDAERAASMQAIGPFWNGNEVWLIAAGGSLFALFPEAYASSFSGFYLPFMVVLWLLMFRGIAMELRSHLTSELWHTFFDAAFALASGLLALIFGVAIANLVRGLPLDAHGYFHGTFAFLLNPYALLVGVFTVVALAQHGATFLVVRVDGPPAVRAMRALPMLIATSGVLFVLVTAATYYVRSGVFGLSWLYAMPLLSLGALVAMLIFVRSKNTRAAFFASSAFLLTLMIEAAGTLFPNLLPSYPSGHGLSIYQAAPSHTALISALIITIVGIIAVIVYGSIVLPKMLQRIRL